MAAVPFSHPMKPSRYRDQDTPYKLLSELQPLRLPAGWLVGLNSFYVPDDRSKARGSPDVLYLTNREHGLILDVSWEPEFDPNGSYAFTAAAESVYPDVLQRGQTPSREEVVAWLHTWLERTAGPGATPALLHPLRITAGWDIQRNEIYETGAPAVAVSTIGERLLFRAIEVTRRFRLDAVWRPDAVGHGGYLLELRYHPWPRDPRGRRITGVPLSFDEDVHVMHQFETRAYAELVRELELWLWRAGSWAVEGH